MRGMWCDLSWGLHSTSWQATYVLPYVVAISRNHCYCGNSTMQLCVFSPHIIILVNNHLDVLFQCIYLFIYLFDFSIWSERRSQWPRVLRRRSSAARLLRLWVRIPRGHGCLSVVGVLCCQVEVSATDWSLVQRSPTDCDQEISKTRRLKPNSGL
jgi:hypothetical protein